MMNPCICHDKAVGGYAPCNWCVHSECECVPLVETKITTSTGDIIHA